MAKSPKAKAEPKRKPGRPATGVDPVTPIRLPAATVEAIDAWAKKAGMNRSDTIRQWIDAGLKQVPARRIHMVIEAGLKRRPKA
jgi:predicted DNA-binding protein